jgi:hypothetical protein
MRADEFDDEASRTVKKTKLPLAVEEKLIDLGLPIHDETFTEVEKGK